MTENYEVLVEDVTDQIFMTVALGDGMYQDTVRVATSGIATMVLVHLTAEDRSPKQYKVDLSTLCAKLANDFLNEQL